MCVIIALNLFSSRVNQSFWLNKKNFLDLQMEIWAGEEKKTDSFGNRGIERNKYHLKELFVNERINPRDSIFYLVQ